MFEDMPLPATPSAVAPDGSLVRPLLRTEVCSIAHFELAAGETSVAVRHRELDEIWYFLSGAGAMWRSLRGVAHVIDVAPGLSLTIPKGTSFQFRATHAGPLTAIGVTMPPWPLEGGAAELTEGAWAPTVEPGPL